MNVSTNCAGSRVAADAITAEETTIRRAFIGLMGPEQPWKIRHNRQAFYSERHLLGKMAATMAASRTCSMPVFDVVSPHEIVDHMNPGPRDARVVGTHQRSTGISGSWDSELGGLGCLPAWHNVCRSLVDEVYT
jgi:hypothetical protein